MNLMPWFSLQQHSNFWKPAWWSHQWFEVYINIFITIAGNCKEAIRNSGSLTFIFRVFSVVILYTTF